MLLITGDPEGTFVSQILRDEKNKNPCPYSHTVIQLSLAGAGVGVYWEKGDPGKSTGE